MAEYEGKKVKLNDPFRLPSGSKKKFGVYVKNPKTGNVIKVEFGDPNLSIKRDDPERLKNFRARHNCDQKTDKTTPGYWSCKFWEKDKPVSKLLKKGKVESVGEGCGCDECMSEDKHDKKGKDMDPRKHVALSKKNPGMYCVFDIKGREVKLFKKKSDAEAYAIKNHDELMKESVNESRKKKITYVINRRTGEVVYGPTDVADAKQFLKKQPQPRKFVIRDIKEDVQLDEETQHIVHVNVSRTGFRKLEAMIASLDGYRESDYSDGKARFYFDAKKHDSAERKKVAEFIKKTRGAEFSHAIKEDVQLDEGSEILFSFDNPMKAGAFATRIKRDKLASEVDRYVSGRKEMVQIIMHPNDYERNDIEKLAKQYKGQLREERAMTYVIDRKTKKIVHGPTDTGDAKLYLKKQIQPGKFMIRQIRGAAKKVGDTV